MRAGARQGGDNMSEIIRQEKEEIFKIGDLYFCLDIELGICRCSQPEHRPVAEDIIPKLEKLREFLQEKNFPATSGGEYWTREGMSGCIYILKSRYSFRVVEFNIAKEEHIIRYAYLSMFGKLRYFVLHSIADLDFLIDVCRNRGLPVAGREYIVEAVTPLPYIKKFEIENFVVKVYKDFILVRNPQERVQRFYFS